MLNFFIQIIALILVNSIETYESIKVNNESTEFHISDDFIEYSNEKAFQILNNKCNVCHRKQNRRRIFTEENMHTWANDIYKQFFIKKRMPRGKKIKLSSDEYQELLNWISSTKINQNGNQL
jgi:uncharacterized membrane protein